MKSDEIQEGGWNEDVQLIVAHNHRQKKDGMILQVQASHTDLKKKDALSIPIHNLLERAKKVNNNDKIEKKAVPVFMLSFEERNSEANVVCFDHEKQT